MIKKTAIKIGRTIYTGRGHGLVGSYALKFCLTDDLIEHSEYGFVDGNGRFFNRDEAYDEALRCGQIKESETSKVNGLFSEDIWDDIEPEEGHYEVH